MHRLSARALLLLPLALVAAGCGDDPVTTPTTPTVPTVTEPFEGTIGRNGANTHAFLVQTTSGVTATLTTVAPDNTVPLGFALGTWNTATEACTLIIANDNATEGRIIVGTAQTSGAFCVRIYDVGKVTQPTSYQVTVVHQ